MEIKKDNPKMINAWCMYDWANSVFNLVIITVIFPMYFLATAIGPDGSDIVDFFGFKVKNDSLQAYAVSAGTFILAILNPFMTALADKSGKRKIFMKIFCYLGAASCAYFYFFTKDTVSSSVIAFMLSVIGWGGSVIFYNSYLPEIASEERLDRVSARGFAYGYVGSVLLLIFNLMLIMKPEWFGFSDLHKAERLPARISFLITGIWWAGFAQIPFWVLPKDKAGSIHFSIFNNALSDIKLVLKRMNGMKYLRRFMAAYFFYYMGVMTVIYVATIFANKELNIPQQGLIITLLLIQLVAIPGSYMASFISEKYGNVVSLRVQIFIWAIVPVAAYFTYKAEYFYGIAAVVGLVMGGIQSLSRSTFAKLIPDEKENNAKFFGIYDIIEKLTTSIGTLVFGLIGQMTGSTRSSLLFLIVMFVIGFIMLMRIPSKKVY